MQLRLHIPRFAQLGQRNCGNDALVVASPTNAGDQPTFIRRHGPLSDRIGLPVQPQSAQAGRSHAMPGKSSRHPSSGDRCGEPQSGHTSGTDRM